MTTDYKADVRMQQAFTNPGAFRQGVVDVEISFDTTNGEDGTWERLGTIEPGTWKMSAEKEKYILERGYPKARVYAAVLGQKGNVSFTLDEVTAKAYEIANGGIATEYTIPAPTTIAADPAPSVSAFKMTVPGAVKAGDWILHTDAAGAKYMRKVKNVDAGLVTLESDLPAAPVSGDAVGVVTKTRNVIGGDTIEQFSARAVVCDQQGDVELLFFKKAESSGKLEPTFDPTKHFQLPIELELSGYSASVNSKTEFIVGEILIINKP